MYYTNKKTKLETIVKLIAILCIFASLFSSSFLLTNGVYMEQSSVTSDTEVLAFDLNTDYAALMIKAAEAGDVERGLEYERLRNLKKEYLGIVDDLTFESVLKEVESSRRTYWWGTTSHELTSSERTLVEQVVAAEARGASYECMLAVAQTIRERSEHWGQSISKTVKYPQYAKPYKGNISEDVKKAVADVFDNGVRVFDEYTTHFHTDYVNPWWNKSKTFRGQIDNVLFWGTDL